MASPLVADEGETIIISGIVLVGSPEDVLKEGGFEGGSVYTCGLELPEENQAVFLDRLTENYLGRQLDADMLLAIKNDILCHYRKCHHPFVEIEIPPQNITKGVIQFVVKEACLGNIYAKGCSWFDNERLASRLNISPGYAIVTNTLLTEIAWMNKNPFRKSSLQFTPGEEAGTTNIELITEDRMPCKVYGGLDNTGNYATGRTRYFAGVTCGNPFISDHILTYQATTSSYFNNFIAQSLNYMAPLSCKHTLYLFGGYANVKPIMDKHFHCVGKSSQASIRYEMPLGVLYETEYIDYRLGFDFKNTNNNLIFLSENEIPLIVNDINLSQFMAGFDCGILFLDHLFELSCELFFSPGQLLPKESNKNYNKLRRGAKSLYGYMSFTTGYVYPFSNGMSLGFVGRGQYASGNLLPSEQFGLGGYDTVRGYLEREVNVDDAACFNLEIRSRPYQLFSNQDQLLLLAFLDYGFGCNAHTYKKETKWFNLLSVGSGFRYNFSQYLSARFDFGFKLIRTPFDHNNGPAVHFGLLASY